MRTSNDFVRPIAISLACLVAPGLPLAALADSGVGVDLWLANKLDPTAGAATQAIDPRGTSWLKPGQSRTPTGFLYLCPAEAPLIVQSGDWQHYGLVELGYLLSSGDNNAMLWQRYTDWSKATAVIGQFELHLVKPLDGSYADVRGSYVSEHNNYLKATVGRAGSYKFEAFTRQQPNVLSSNARSIWNGVGSNNLTLVDGLTPAGSTVAQVEAASANAREQTLQVNRDKQGLGLTWFLSRRWSAYGNVTNESREGARPFGGPFFFNFAFANNGGVYETPRPIKDSTINGNFGARFVGNQWRADIGYSGSFYRSAYTGFSYEVPFALWNVVQGPAVTSSQLTSGQFSSEPDNNYHSLRATLTRALPMDGQFSLTASGASMRQDDDLLAPINCTGTFGIDLAGNGQVGPTNPFLYNCADWNTTDALSRKTADMRIDTSLVDARFVLQPTSSLTWRGGLRFYREDYRNTYLAYNPITGEYGYVAENGSQGSIVPGEVGIWNPITGASIVTRVSSLPLDTQNIETNIGADWRLSRANSFGATLSYTRNEPEHRERSEINDSSVKLNWTNRGIDWLTFRANYVFFRRDGDRYNYDPYEFTFSDDLPGFVEPAGGIPAHTVDALRKYDMSSRDQHKVDLMATVMPRDDMTLSASLRADRNDYDATLGRQDADSMGVTLQWEWAPSPRTNASVFIGYDRSEIGIANVNEAVSDNPDPSLGGPTYPLANRWWVDDVQRNRSVGVSFAQSVGKARVDASWNWNFSRGATDYRFSSAAALAWPDIAAIAGSGFPDSKYKVNGVTVGISVPISPAISLRLFDYYERGRISDWHYLGFDQGLVIDHRVYTDGGPQSYNANLVGLLLSLKL